jgi:uncharacterized protein (TIGR03067 family)
MLHSVFFLWLALAAAEGQGQPAKTAADRDSLQGTWRVVAVKSDAKEDPEQKLVQVTFQDDWVLLGVAGRQGPEKARCRIDASRDPKRIDVELQIFEASIWIEGIYALQRDALTLCFASGEKKRPARFDGSPGSGCILLKLQRVKK